ncbi:hypothetical protein [Sphingomonas nostoxanthinifaciens]|uniref:hypothetical protein n=1 Tax=Sphingomonas nostoxanthinifaciens TaxID=2872652 RepID=UPI001CC1C351|nr:hypothetical protein [Sphingomonas nostoxanthinifaciens]UAK23640.1 hypothetical protein K8P63_14790 [Sphingomonas nostoxanthinifaciens]
MLARKSTRPRRQNSHRADDIKRCPPFLQWVRGRSCLLLDKRGHECRGRVRACHVDYAGDKGVGTKVSDRHAVPMCDGAHAEQTGQLGWGPFEAKWGINALESAADLWRYWLDGTVMGAKWKRAREGEGA